MLADSQALGQGNEDEQTSRGRAGELLGCHGAIAFVLLKYIAIFPMALNHAKCVYVAVLLLAYHLTVSTAAKFWRF